jgi:hypothetical protein
MKPYNIKHNKGLRANRTRIDVHSVLQDGPHYPAGARQVPKRKGGDMPSKNHRQARKSYKAAQDLECIFAKAHKWDKRTNRPAGKVVPGRTPVGLRKAVAENQIFSGLAEAKYPVSEKRVPIPKTFRSLGAGPFCSHVPNGPFNAYLSS